mgnify:CR=1 FL=1
MKQLAVAVGVIALVVSTAASATPASESLEGPLEPFLGRPQFEKQRLFEHQRFPNVVVALDGTILATWGSETVKVRRSGDGGETWGPEIMIGSGIHGGSLVDESTGDVLVFVHPEHPPRDSSTAPRTMYRSTDGGRTWDTPRPLSYDPEEFRPVENPIAPCPLYRLEDGRLLLVFYDNDGTGPSQGSPFITAVVYDATVTITYESTDVYYRATIRLAPEEL